MNRIARKIAIGLTFVAVSGAALAQAKPEDLIRWRQSAYQTMAWNMGRIKANLEGSYNKDQVAQAANVIQALANSGMGALYAAGTDKGKGWHDTRVKPEFFKEGDKVKELAVATDPARRHCIADGRRWAAVRVYQAGVVAAAAVGGGNNAPAAA